LKPKACEPSQWVFHTDFHRIQNRQIFRVAKIAGIIVRPSKRSPRPKLCESDSEPPDFRLSQKNQRKRSSAPKQCLRPELCQLATNRQILASEKNEDFGERLKPISRGRLFTRFQIEIRRIRPKTTVGHSRCTGPSPDGYGGGPRLFSELKADKYGNCAAYALKRFRETYLPAGIKMEPRQSFYSFRHSWRDALRALASLRRLRRTRHTVTFNRLLQQNRPISDSCTAAKNVAIRSPHRQSQAICLGW
jgi:hypothetical protein